MKPVLQIALPLSFAISLALTGCAGDSKAKADDAAEQTVQRGNTLDPSGIRDVSVAQAETLIAGAEGLVILDVRTPEEFDADHVEGAINVDFRDEEFASALAKLDRDTPYLLYCRSGNRSGQALDLMQTQGFQNVAHMNEGFIGWQANADGK